MHNLEIIHWVHVTVLVEHQNGVHSLPFVCLSFTNSVTSRIWELYIQFPVSVLVEDQNGVHSLLFVSLKLTNSITYNGIMLHQI